MELIWVLYKDLNSLAALSTYFKNKYILAYKDRRVPHRSSSDIRHRLSCWKVMLQGIDFNKNKMIQIPNFIKIVEVDLDTTDRHKTLRSPKNHVEKDCMKNLGYFQFLLKAHILNISKIPSRDISSFRFI